LPISSQCLPCPLATAGGEAIGEHDGINCSGARSGDPVEIEGLFFEQAVEHTPGESAVAATTLECQVHNSPFTVLRGLPFGPICLVEESHGASPGKSHSLLEGSYICRKVCSFRSR